MAEDRFERLLGALPRIADSVKQFESESVQQQVIDGLLQALMAGDGPVDEAAVNTEDTSTDQAGEVDVEETPTQGEKAPRRARAAKKNASMKAQPARRSTSSAISIRTDINFRPDNIATLKTFVAEKKPKSLYSKIAVIIFWLIEHSDEQTVDAGAVAAGIREIGERQPADLGNTLSITAGSRYGYINARNRNDLTLTVLGDNLVRHDLPADS